LSLPVIREAADAPGWSQARDRNGQTPGVLATVSNRTINHIWYISIVDLQSPACWSHSTTSFWRTRRFAGKTSLRTYGH